MDAVEPSIESTIAQWHGIQPPNAPARRLAAELMETIAAFEALRGTIAFEDEPSGFEAALQATKDEMTEGPSGGSPPKRRPA